MNRARRSNLVAKTLARLAKFAKKEFGDEFGDPNFKKSALWNIRLKVFGAKGAENFKKLRVLSKN